MRSRFFDIAVEEIKENKDVKKTDALKAWLFLYVACISKVVFEEIENLRDDNYLFLEYLIDNDFEYNLKETYLENMKILSEKIELFKESYNFVVENLEVREVLSNMTDMELELKLDILRGRYTKIAQNFVSKVINLPIIQEEKITNLLVDFLNVKSNELLYNADFFELNNFYNEVVDENEKNEILKILLSMANSNNENKTVVILTKNSDSKNLISELLNKNDKMIMDLETFELFENKEEIIRNNWVEAVISIPYNNILRNQIVVLNKEKLKDDVLFIQTQNYFEKANDKIKAENYEKLSKVFKNREEINGVSKVVSNEKILFKNCNLDILTYVFKTKEKIDLKELEFEKNQLSSKMEESRKECDRLIAEYLPDEQ